MLSLSAPKKRVAIVGCGAAGLAAAYLLGRGEDIELTLFESGQHMGGHANTVEVNGVPIDTGFLVYNENTYPNLIGLFEVWKMDSRPSAQQQHAN